MCTDDQDEFPSPLLIGLITEIIGTAVMMLMGCMGCIFTMGLGPILPSFSFAFSVLAALQMLHAEGPVHMNPGVSLAFFIMQKMSGKRFIVYIFGQYVGALLGYAVLYSLCPENSGNVCLLTVRWQLPAYKAFLLEMIGCMVLIWIILGAVDAKNAGIVDSLPLRISFGLCGIIFSLEPLTGAGLNSARALPPALLCNMWDDHWLYQIAPLVGTSLGAIIYKYIIDDTCVHSFHSWLKKKSGGGEAV